MQSHRQQSENSVPGSLGKLLKLNIYTEAAKVLPAESLARTATRLGVLATAPEYRRVARLPETLLLPFRHSEKAVRNIPSTLPLLPISQE